MAASSCFVGLAFQPHSLGAGYKKQQVLPSMTTLAKWLADIKLMIIEGHWANRQLKRM